MKRRYWEVVGGRVFSLAGRCGGCDQKARCGGQDHGTCMVCDIEWYCKSGDTKMELRARRCCLCAIQSWSILFVETSFLGFRVIDRFASQCEISRGYASMLIVLRTHIWIYYRGELHGAGVSGYDAWLQDARCGIRSSARRMYYKDFRQSFHVGNSSRRYVLFRCDNECYVYVTVIDREGNTMNIS